MSALAGGQESTALTLKTRIALPNVNGRIDHLSVDVKGDARMKERQQRELLHPGVQREVLRIVPVVARAVHLDAFEARRAEFLDLGQRLRRIDVDLAVRNDNVWVVGGGLPDDVEAGHRRQHARHRAARSICVDQARHVIGTILEVLVRVDDQPSRGLRRWRGRWSSAQSESGADPQRLHEEPAS